jgi:hypothetical protein
VPYIAEIEFYNIKRLHIRQMNRQQYGADYYEIVIEMKKPCTVLKLLPKMRAVVRSPFNFNVQQSYYDTYPVNKNFIDEDFMTNYWNVNQVFLI